jgi:hypothetical protein
MQLLVNIDSPADINNAIATLNKLLPATERDATRRASAMPLGLVDDPSVGADPAPVEDKPKRGRPRKEQVAEAAQEVAAEPVGKPQQEETTSSSVSTTDSSAPATTSHTLDDIRAALKGYTTKHGMDAGIALLAKYGAQRVSEVPAEKYAEFVAEAA